jgi:hypothetical protein
MPYKRFWALGDTFAITRKKLKFDFFTASTRDVPQFSDKKLVNKGRPHCRVSAAGFRGRPLLRGASRRKAGGALKPSLVGDPSNSPLA